MCVASTQVRPESAKGLRVRGLFIGSMGPSQESTIRSVSAWPFMTTGRWEQSYLPLGSHCRRKR